jgi:hypothetical protein
MKHLGTCTTDSGGTAVTRSRGRSFDATWATLPLVIGGATVTIASVQSESQLTLASPVGPFTTTPATYGPCRETIYQALFNLMKGSIQGLRNVCRRSVVFSDLPPEQQPALYLEQIGESPKTGPTGGLAYQWDMDVMLGLYVFNEDPDQVFPNMNPLLDAIEAALPGDNPRSPGGHPQTLGGLVEWARLTGEEKPYSGAKGGQGFAYVPARITTW